MRKIFVVDTETTSLNPDTREAWDIAWAVYNPTTDEVEKRGQFFNRVNIREADPMSLAMNHFWDRYPDSPQHVTSNSTIDSMNLGGPLEDGWVKMWQDSRDCTFAGIVPSFDEHTLRKHLLANRLQPAWHYKLFDVVTWASGVLGMLEASTEDVCVTLGIPEVPDNIRHTAEGDVQMTVEILRAARNRVEKKMAE